MTRVAWIEAPAGIAGDMCLAALLDAGLPREVLDDVVRGLELEGVAIETHDVMRGAIAATKVDVCKDGTPIEGKDDVHVHVDDHGHTHTHTHGHRTLADVKRILARLGSLDEGPLAQAAAVFEALADAEARVHGTTRDDVHFHEVGAADALVDIVGTCVGLHHLGVERVHVSALPWGSGTVETAHGTMPIPAPATVRLLEGWPTTPSPETYEQVTPTGAALVRVLAAGSTPPEGFVVRHVGHGAGGFDGGALPNVVRVTIGDVGLAEGRHEEAVVLLETNVDDVSGQVVAYALERAREVGALDAWWRPVHMKKDRPGVLVSVLCEPGQADACEAVLFRELDTLGIRRQSLTRQALPRRFEAVETRWGTVTMKVRDAAGETRAVPEYEDCRRLAREHDVPLRDVFDAARRAWDDTQA